MISSLPKVFIPESLDTCAKMFSPYTSLLFMENASIKLLFSSQKSWGLSKFMLIKKFLTLTLFYNPPLSRLKAGETRRSFQNMSKYPGKLDHYRWGKHQNFTNWACSTTHIFLSAFTFSSTTTKTLKIFQIWCL